MAALVPVYVDPALNSNTGTGTSGDPYGDLQYALDTHTRDTTDGNEILIATGAEEELAAVLNFGTWGAPTADVPTVIRGNGGRAVIDANGGAAFPATNYLHLRNLEIKNGGSSNLVSLGTGGSIVNCKVADTTGVGIVGAFYAVASGNEITDCTTGILVTGVQFLVYGNYLKFGATRNFTNAMSVNGQVIVERNIISVGTSGNGISKTGVRGIISGNSVLANGSTGYGIGFNHAGRGDSSAIINNVAEGFTGASTGAGFDFATATNVPQLYAGNAAYNNTTNYRNPGDIGIVDDIDNEVLSASPFAKSGADTFANRYVYFAPVDTGNMRGGAVQ